MSRVHPLLWAAGGAGAVWAVARWRERQASLDDAWGAGHDEDDVEPAREPGPSASASRPLSRRYDADLTAYGQGLPLPYLRALAARESGLRADDPKGLINVVPVVREDYNARHGTRYQARDLTNPAVNITIAADTLRRIIDSYARNHPHVPNLHEDWDNRAFVELLTFGWNAGYSEKAGVGRVVRYLEEHGHTDITLGDVAKNAYVAGASHWLWAHPKKVALVARRRRTVRRRARPGPAPPAGRSRPRRRRRARAGGPAGRRSRER